MTTKDAILKLADAVSGNTSANVVTDVQALAVLAQAMTGGVPAEPLATVDDAIGYIADNYGGGGGVTLGDVCLVIADDATVKPGDEIGGGSAIMKISVGDAVVTDMTAGAIWQNTMSTAAAGTTVDVFYAHINEGDKQAPSMRARTCTVNSETYAYVTISDTIELEHEEYAIRDTDEPVYAARFVMPEIPEGSALLLTPEYSI